MHPASFLFLAAGALALPEPLGSRDSFKRGKPNLQIGCDSHALDNSGQTKWLASTKDCSAAAGKLADMFKAKAPDRITLPSKDCVAITTFGDCEVSICHANNIRKDVYPYEIYAAARLLHARHKSDGDVAGWVAIEDQYDQFQAFVKLAQKDTGPPGGMNWKATPNKRGIDSPRANVDADSGQGIDAQTLEARAEPPQIIVTPPDDDKSHTINRSKERIVREDNRQTPFETEMRISWGNPQYRRRTSSDDQDIQMQERLVELFEDRTRDNGRPLAVRPAPYLAPTEPGEEGGVYIGMELVAANNQNLRAFGRPDELKDVLNFARLQWLGSRSGNFIMRVWRGGNEIGHVLIRAWRERYPGNGEPTCPQN